MQNHYETNNTYLTQILEIPHDNEASIASASVEPSYNDEVQKIADSIPLKKVNTPVNSDN